MLVFEERGKPEYPKKNLSEQRREPTTNSTHIWRRRRDLNPGHIGGRRELSPLRHPLLSFTAHETVILQSRQVKRTPQDSINELPIIWKMNPLVVPATSVKFKTALLHA